MSLLLKNAVESIQIGVEDFDSDDERRYLSAVRNVYAGLLLLYKYHLFCLSPDYDKELLIKKNIAPKIGSDGNIDFMGDGKSTVDVCGIRKRFKNLNVEVEWKMFEKIQKLRNDIEHYYVGESLDKVKDLFAQIFILIKNFVSTYLNKEPAQLLGNDCWAVLLENNAVYEETRKECLESIEKVDCKFCSFGEVAKHFSCPECDSELIKVNEEGDYHQELGLICMSCSNEFEVWDIIEDAVQSSSYGHNYYAYKDGEEPSIGTCPECSKETYIFDDDVCLACGESRAYKECKLCSCELSVDEQWAEGYCAYHHEMLSKDD
ncbi:hypothetical protein [Maridesulfovibrio ferrireducens]|uniref:hypothetical protein n=1 Tax=Maridesulfovibrio ferrireducens TaxID=246191 RepID=UPI001A201018|nr:hypothetical protein [Maridesulfovibrio ferrireducens]MBI9110724.1 hypothetical protein [Maridesulfovibrio ferrireducens]